MRWESRKPRKILNNGNIKDLQQFWRKGGGGALRLRLWRYSRYNSQQRPSRTLCPMTCAGSKNLWSENESVHLKISTWGDDSHCIRETPRAIFWISSDIYQRVVDNRIGESVPTR